MAHRGDAHDAQAGQSDEVPAGKAATAVLHVGGLGWASEKAVVARVLGRRPGVRLVEANPVSQTAAVTFDIAQTSVAELRRWAPGWVPSGEAVVTRADGLGVPVARAEGLENAPGYGALARVDGRREVPDS